MNSGLRAVRRRVSQMSLLLVLHKELHFFAPLSFPALHASLWTNLTQAVFRSSRISSSKPQLIVGLLCCLKKGPRLETPRHKDHHARPFMVSPSCNFGDEYSLPFCVSMG